jgi:hypothetical protein
MNDHLTSLVRRLTRRATGPIARWQRRPPGRLQAADTFARQAGWTITRTRLGGRIYRDPRFSQPGAIRTPGPPDEPAPPAALTRRSPAPAPAPGYERLQAGWTAREDPVADSTSKPPASGRLAYSVNDCRITKENQL